MSNGGSVGQWVGSLQITKSRINLEQVYGDNSILFADL